MKVSIIVPVYNEEKTIGSCLASLAKQTVECEIIVVDDGSTDGSAKFATYRQSHKGPGAARNLGASKATGDILVFVDADMEFEKDFVEKLITPIIAGKTIGTFSKEEYLLNKDNVLARCWNLNLGRKAEQMEPRDFDTNKNFFYQWGKSVWQRIEGSKISFEKNKSHVFRAILKSEFDKAGGFDTNVGYTDDWSLSRKLNTLATLAPGAKFYHRNPATFSEVWAQARWFGKNEFLTKNLIRKVFNLFRYFPGWAIFVLYDPNYFVFKLVYNSAVFTSVLLSFFGEKKFK